MSTLRSTLCILLLLITSLGWGQNTGINSLLQQAHQQRTNYDDLAAIGTFKKVLEIDSTHLDALFNVAYLYSRQGWLSNEHEQQLAFHTQAIDYANKCYTHHPNSYQANLIMAGTIARMSEFESVRNRVHAAWDIKKYSDVAVAISPENPEVWYMLAWWNFEISKATWFERSMAKMLFGGLPNNASYEAALEGIKKAIELRPDYIPYVYDLAKFYEYSENFGKAIELLRKAVTMTPKAPEEHDYLKRCKKMMGRLMN